MNEFTIPDGGCITSVHMSGIPHTDIGNCSLAVLVNVGEDNEEQCERDYEEESAIECNN